MSFYGVDRIGGVRERVQKSREAPMAKKEKSDDVYVRLTDS